MWMRDNRLKWGKKRRVRSGPTGDSKCLIDLNSIESSDIDLC